MKKMFISDDSSLIIDDYLSYPILLSLSFSYQKHFDSIPNVYVSKDLTFNDVWKRFVEKKIVFLNIGQIRFNEEMDCCLSLFYNPYFDDLYSKIKSDINNIPRGKIKVLEKHILRELASPEKKLKIGEAYILGHDFYENHDVYNKSNELLNLIRSSL